MEDLRHIAFKNYYISAIESISRYGLFWFTDTSAISYELESLISEAGYKVLLCEIAPRWEFVIYEPDKFDFKTLSIIAMDRYKAWESGVEEYLLPNT